MKPSSKFLTILTFLVLIGIMAWWFGPWRLRTVLADKKTDDGTRYCIVQVYKDFAESGWVVGVYLLEEDGKWRLRSSGRSKTPWKKAVLENRSGKLVFHAKSDTESVQANLDITSREMPWEEGWVLPGNLTSRQIQANLIHSTY